MTIKMPRLLDRGGTGTGLPASRGTTVPYVSNDDLPPGVRNGLPPHAQDIFREAFNHAWRQYSDRKDREAISHRVAWAAVKKRYVKVGSRWVKRQHG